MRSMRSLWVVLALILAVAAWHHLGPSASTGNGAGNAPTTATESTEPTRPSAVVAGRSMALPVFLPAEAATALDLIARGGPYPHPQDGVVFQNREGRLPTRERGYYHEYTVETPGLDYRGARRIITGGNPPVEYYYTDDHYRTFRPFKVTP